MSVHYPVSAVSDGDSRYEFVLTRAGRQRRFSLSVIWIWIGLVLIPLLGTLYLGATFYLFFHDDMMSALMARQARQQYAYEDRLAALRLQLDRVTSRQMLDQDSFEGKVRHLVERQAQLETRTALVSALTDRIAGPGAAAVSIPAAPAMRAPRAAVREEASHSLSAAPVPAARSTGAAPLKPPADAADAPPSNKPRPEGFELRSSENKDGAMPARSSLGAGSAMLNGAAGVESDAAERLAEMGQNDAALPIRLSAITASLDVIELRQVKSLAALAQPIAVKTEQLKTAFTETGLSLGKFVQQKAPAAAVGGPYIPVNTGGTASLFDRQFTLAQNAFSTLEKLRQALPYAPLRKPLEGSLEVSSTFGYRIDPFLGRPALHSGLDLKADMGASVYATASGKVTTADVTGGYGNMVEIEHAPGVATRYGHLSAILVREGDTVAAGMLIGRVGSTGRSTGPHLHYEVRLDDEATDPARFVRAARLVNGKE